MKKWLCLISLMLFFVANINAANSDFFGYKESNCTYNSVMSLGTSEGWRNLGQGFTNMGHLANQYSPEGMIMRAQLASSATNYFNNIPNMSLYEITSDIGFAVEQIAAGVLFSKGVGLTGKYRDFY